MITTLLNDLRDRLSDNGWKVDHRVHWRLEAYHGPHHVTVRICPNTFLWCATYGRVEGIGTRKGWVERRNTEKHDTPESAFDALEVTP